jgi:hypothetical protein
MPARIVAAHFDKVLLQASTGLTALRRADTIDLSSCDVGFTGFGDGGRPVFEAEDRNRSLGSLRRFRCPTERRSMPQRLPMAV